MRRIVMFAAFAAAVYALWLRPAVRAQIEPQPGQRGKASDKQATDNDFEISIEGPDYVRVGAPIRLTTKIRNTSNRYFDNVRVNIEAYDPHPTQRQKKVSEHQSFGPRESKTYEVTWVFPKPVQLRVAVGLFQPGVVKPEHGNDPNYIPASVWKETAKEFVVIAENAPAPE